MAPIEGEMLSTTTVPCGAVLFLGARVTRENNYYILMVRGSVSLKLSMDSAGRTISFSPV
jgi:hypothetical protein